MPIRLYRGIVHPIFGRLAFAISPVLDCAAMISPSRAAPKQKITAHLAIRCGRDGSRRVRSQRKVSRSTASSVVSPLLDPVHENLRATQPGRLSADCVCRPPRSLQRDCASTVEFNGRPADTSEVPEAVTLQLLVGYLDVLETNQ